MCRATVGLAVTVALLASFADLRGEDNDTKDTAPEMYPAAVLPFQEQGAEVKELGAKVTDLLFAKLSADPGLMLVDRDDLKRVLDEQKLNISGLVSPDTATKVGQLTGAELLITGSVLQVDDTLYLIAKIIGTETTRVVGATVKGNARDDLGRLAEELGEEIGKTVAQRADDLVAKSLSRDDRIAALNAKLGETKRPSLLIGIPERHIGAPSIDPAAETELTLFATSTGFKVIDAKEGRRKDADLLLEGEAFSERAVHHGDLISVKARVEVKAIDQASGRVVAIDRQTTVAVDLTEQIAAKNALQEAGAVIAERLLPKLAAPEKQPRAAKGE
jgi:TolB-like protein